MELLPEELNQLYMVLINAFPTEESFTLLIRLQLGENPDVIAPGNGLGIRLLNLIDWAQSKGRLEDLLTRAPEDIHQKENLVLKTVTSQILDSVRSRQTKRWFEPEDPLDALFLHDGRAFVDRKKLRVCLKNLQTNLSKRVLIVNGAPVSGKSYSYRLIAELATKSGYKLAYIDLKDEVISKFGPDDLVRSIARQIKLPTIQTIPTQQSADSRWVQELRDWLLGEASAANQKWWIILDGFDHRDLPPETQQLIEHLLKQVDSRLPSVRLVLLSYNRPLPREIRRYIMDEQINSIGETELTEHFTKLFEESGKTYTANSVKAAVDKVLSLVPKNDPEWLYDLTVAVEDVASAIFSEEETWALQNQT